MVVRGSEQSRRQEVDVFGAIRGGCQKLVQKWW
jgi:hypothetical protein